MRLPDAPEGGILPDGYSVDQLQGGYWRTSGGSWMTHVWMAGVPAPGFEVGLLCGHEVIEHDDGTITVSPSILVESGDGRRRWHGHLLHGVWRALDDCVLA